MGKAEISREKQPAIFKNPILEKLTYTHPGVITAFYIILASAMLYQYWRITGASIGIIAMWFGVGLFTWTFGEYILHRFLYHDIRDASYDKGIQYLFHGIHHKYPYDNRRIVLPILPSILIASILFGVFYLIMGTLAWAFAPGFLIGYLLYMMIHLMVHSVPSPKKFNFWWRHHNIHHYQQHDRAFGVSSPLWDIIFRTMPEPGRKTTVETN
ncbi:MAG: sterol desaturase family protein [Bacteroidota bacterium]|nr:sterol desaturase family protein [Bacteroidota bacterium]